MKKLFLILSLFTIFYNSLYPKNNFTKPDQIIFVFGGDINKKFVQYVIELTGKERPKICYLPTASADNEKNIKYWNFLCDLLKIEPQVLKVWVSSDKSNKSFEDILLNTDALVIGGGNTLNMLGIWKAQGIDTILQKALKKGVIISGGSAGSICCFKTGISDSRPTCLSIVDGLSFLPFSNCPHYSDSTRKQLYHQLIKNQSICSGYASDDLSGVLFVNGKLKEAVSLNDINHSYYVHTKNSDLISEKLYSKIFISKNAISTDSYSVLNIDKPVKAFNEMYDLSNPLNSFISIRYLFANGKNSKYKHTASQALKARLSDTTSDIKIEDKLKNKFLNTEINKVLVYEDSVAGVINNSNDGYFGLWYFYNENGSWLSAGEDIGGDTMLEAEITFREKAKMHFEKLKQQNTGK